ncbi:thiamine-phosphate diphosphorylase [Hydrogenivirga caldilitoris]|uniref:Thiamine-phosphate synthase n=1 Tax=Hydrogenivirga caldilitoris TaxID=246264 RepID=A0A497XQ50_9AQUI|nr:thiamine phosphate synthase [Hydrogenivirga caldilitoris]RLJ70280.1 thiamine-phosphate diphosphorylase [Hydrogenivirga caldilitoris]
MNLTIYLITDDKYFKGRDLLETIEKALQGGVTAVQYRFKNKSTREMYEELLKLRELTRKYRADLVVNDRVDLALAVDADGVHVGKEDLPPEAVRKVVGDRLYIGYTANSLEEVKRAQELPVDYIGFGSIYPTTTKESYKLVGVEALTEAIRLSKKPIVCIGGIMPYRVSEVVKAGCRNMAISAGILGFEDVKKAAEEIKRAYKETMKQLMLLGKV